MAGYRVRGLTGQGGVEERHIAAASPDEAGRLARHAGLQVLDIVPLGFE